MGVTILMFWLAVLGSFLTIPVHAEDTAAPSTPSAAQSGQKGHRHHHKKKHHRHHKHYKETGSSVDPNHP